MYALRTCYVQTYLIFNTVKIFELHQKISVAVSALNKAFIDDKRIFEWIIHMYENSYIIQIKYSVLNRNYSTSELNELSDNINLDILNSVSTKKITLHLISAQQSTTEKISIHCECSHWKNWCQTRRYNCFKANVKCSIACHEDEDSVDCSNISFRQTRTQKRHQQWKQMKLNDVIKWQRLQ